MTLAGAKLYKKCAICVSVTPGDKLSDNGVKPYATVLFGVKCHSDIFFYKVVEKEEGENRVME